jgi:uncharacterized membrane protein
MAHISNTHMKCEYNGRNTVVTTVQNTAIVSAAIASKHKFMRFYSMTEDCMMCTYDAVVISAIMTRTLLLVVSS